MAYGMYAIMDVLTPGMMYFTNSKAISQITTLTTLKKVFTNITFHLLTAY
jgi:hypothetical protein